MQNSQPNKTFNYLFLFVVLSLAFLLLSAAFETLTAQNSDKHANQLTGSQSLYNAYSTTPEAFRILGTVTHVQKGFVDATSSSADTLSRNIYPTANGVDSVFSTYFRFTVSADDTVQLSYSSSFDSTEIIILLPDVVYTSPFIDVATINNFYYKLYGTAGTPTTYWSLFGL